MGKGMRLTDYLESFIAPGSIRWEAAGCLYISVVFKSKRRKMVPRQNNNIGGNLGSGDGTYEQYIRDNHHHYLKYQYHYRLFEVSYK